MSDAHAGRRERCRALRRVADLCKGGMRAFESGQGPLGERMTRDALALVRSLGGLTVLEGRIHRKDQALLLLANALRLAREIERPMLESLSKHNMGLIFRQAGQDAEAAVCFRVALSLAGARGKPGRGLSGVIERSLRDCAGARDA